MSTFTPHRGEWRATPLPLTTYALGQGPFRVRGLAYTSALEYVDKRLDGGKGALGTLMRGDPYAPYLEQMFIVTGDYDVSPLLALHVALAKHREAAVGEFIERRARASARPNILGVWRPSLKRTEPEEAAERLHYAFNRYFSPTLAQNVSSAPGRFEGVLSKVPAPMSALYVHSTVGFFRGALELTGIPSISTTFAAPADDGKLDDVKLQRLRFVVEWPLG